MSLATAATHKTKFENECQNITSVEIINAQHLQSNNVHAKVTLFFQYTHPWWLSKKE